ncbi:MAG: ribosome small subunit-dependent GTPase A [Ruminococcus sp.]|nr:ribosome small subunit-dependent GTPase A [Ruminococcus sp.]MDY4909521.1 ribosome small subunit-dependent GTPase A [Candidatus Fimenecus sp.]
MKTLNGTIIKGIGGFYYVEAADEIYECKARGVFRKEKLSPLVGDKVTISINENAENTIDEIMPRKNALTRPPVVNIDNLIIVVSTVEPKPSTLVIDKLIAVAEHKNIEPIIVITKSDLASAQEIFDIYTLAGFKTIIVSNETKDGVDEVKVVLKDKISALTGNSGVGKTSLLNNLDETLALKTAQISKKLGRGRHTTRQAELYRVCDGFVVDTPGFSSFEIDKSDIILKDELAYCFRDFSDYIEKCKFYPSCTHTADKGCAVVEAVNEGKISKSRHNSYVQLYNEVKDIKEWNL